MEGQANENDVNGQEEPPSNTPSQFTYPPTSILTRRLKSFPPPNLAVLVGPNQHIFHYHAFILASQSDYVDTLLSSPAAMNEREQMKISFPEVEVQVWEKMMKLLEPGGLRPAPELTDLVQVLPFYDKYQFRGGVRICDLFLSDVLTSIEGRSVYGYIRDCEEKENALAKLVVLSYELDLPKSKVHAVKYAGLRLKYVRSCNEELVSTMLPLLENDDAILRTLVSTVLGRKCHNMTVEEIRNVSKGEDFAKQCIRMHDEIVEVDEQVKQLGCIKELYISSNTNAVNGKYTLRQESKIDDWCANVFPSASGDHQGGAMKNVWVKENNIYRSHCDSEKFVLEAADVFGNVWEVSCITVSDDDESQTIRDVLYKWEGNRSSLSPPKSGWVAVEEHHTAQLHHVYLDVEFQYEMKGRY